MPTVKIFKRDFPKLPYDILILKEKDINKIVMYVSEFLEDTELLDDLDSGLYNKIHIIEGSPEGVQLSINHSKDYAERNEKTFKYIDKIPQDDSKLKQFQKIDLSSTEESNPNKLYFKLIDMSERFSEYQIKLFPPMSNLLKNIEKPIREVVAFTPDEFGIPDKWCLQFYALNHGPIIYNNLDFDYIEKLFKDIEESLKKNDYIEEKNREKFINRVKELKSFNKFFSKIDYNNDTKSNNEKENDEYYKACIEFLNYFKHIGFTKTDTDAIIQNLIPIEEFDPRFIQKIKENNYILLYKDLERPKELLIYFKDNVIEIEEMFYKLLDQYNDIKWYPENKKNIISNENKDLKDIKKFIDEFKEKFKDKNLQDLLNLEMVINPNFKLFKTPIIIESENFILVSFNSYTKEIDLRLIFRNSKSREEFREYIKNILNTEKILQDAPEESERLKKGWIELTDRDKAFLERKKKQYMKKLELDDAESVAARTKQKQQKLEQDQKDENELRNSIAQYKEKSRRKKRMLELDSIQWNNYNDKTILENLDVFALKVLSNITKNKTNIQENDKSNKIISFIEFIMVNIDKLQKTKLDIVNDLRQQYEAKRHFSGIIFKQKNNRYEISYETINNIDVLYFIDKNKNFQTVYIIPKNLINEFING